MVRREKLEVLVIGAGFAGICAGKNLLDNGITNFQIYEKANGIGGTWWDNSYPGAKCDIPSHLYCYSFEPNPVWSQRYAPQPEIQGYLEHCAAKYGLAQHLNLGRKVVSLTFDETRSVWAAGFENGEIIEARFVIGGTGALHVPKIPKFKDSDLFEGTAMHSATWKPDFDPGEKRIAVIGSAASAIQLVPVIARKAAHVSVFQRTPNYIAPRRDYAYSDRQKWSFRKFPFLMKLYRFSLFMELELLLYPIVTREKFRRRRADFVKKYMRGQVKKRGYRRAITPKYEMGCKRILISNDFLPALNRDNVELVTDPIERFTRSGIVKGNGVEQPFDAVVYATGFDIEGHHFNIDLRGEGGLSLREAWKVGADAYRGVMVPGFPNYFMVTGPNTGVGTTSVVFMIEQTVGWIMKCLRRAGGDKMVSVTAQASADYNTRIQEAFANTVWSSGCDSWYRKADGRIETLYPHNARSFRTQMRRIDTRHVRFTKCNADLRKSEPASLLRTPAE